MKTIEQIIQQFDKRVSARANFESMWQDIIDHYLPRRASIHWQDTQGTDKTRKIYDSTPGTALMRLAAVLQSMLTNRELEWFQLETDDEKLNEQQEVKEWLEADADVLRKSLSNSNFYQQCHELYIDLGGMGMGVMYIEEYKNPSRDFYFSTRHLREAYISEGEQGETDSIDLLRSMTARQIIERWDKQVITGAIPEKVRKAMDKDQEQRFEILQSVYPNEDYNANIRNPLYFKYQCAWIDRNEKKEIHRGGYHEFPFIIVPWAKATGEDYGRGPGWDALADVKTLYAMKKTLLRVAEKIADPPLQVPKKGFISPTVKLTPGGINFYDVTTQARIEPIEIGANFPITLEMLQDQREQINDQFFVTQLQLIDVREMTAEEARLRTAENARIIGPTFGRLNDDYLDRLIDRCRGILARNGKLTEIPQVVLDAAKEKGTQLRVKFVSPLAKAQAASDVQGIQLTAQTAFDWVEKAQDPSVIDNLDLDEGIRKIAELDGSPAEFLRNEDEVKRVRKQRLELIEMKTKLALAEQAGKAGKDLAEASSKAMDIQERLT
jgi:hypothetical protein